MQEAGINIKHTWCSSSFSGGIVQKRCIRMQKAWLAVLYGAAIAVYGEKNENNLSETKEKVLILLTIRDFCSIINYR